MKEVADAIGITPAALRRIERGEVSISHPVLADLCKYYDLQPGDLLEYQDRLTRREAEPYKDHTSRRVEGEAARIVAAIPMPQPL